MMKPVSFSQWKRIKWLLCANSPGRLAYALRSTAACTFVVLVNEVWQVPDQAIPALVTLAVWQKDRVTNVIVGIALSFLILVLVTFLFVFVKLTVDNQVLQVASVAILSFGFFFLGSASKLRPLAYIMGLIVVYGLIAVDNIPSGELITRALLYVNLFLLIPGATLVGLGMLICPSPKALLCNEIAARLRNSARLLRREHGSIKEEADSLKNAGDAGMMKYAALAAKEKLWQQKDLACLTHAARSSVAVLVITVDYYERGDFEDRSTAELARLLDEAAEIFDAGDYPSSITLSTFPDSQEMTIIAELLSNITHPPHEDIVKKIIPKKSSFFVPDAFSNSVHARYALKGTASVMLAYFCFKLTNWNGIHTIIITCFIVAQATMGEMIAKLSLRISGAIVGGTIAILSIIFIIPHLRDVTGFLGLLAFVTLLAAWVKAGDERVSYGGFQIGLAFFLTLLKDYGPTTDMETARDRMVGIIAGNLITYAIFTSFWPVSAYTEIPSKLRNLREALRALNDATGVQQRAKYVGAAQHAIDEVARSIEFARLEPHHLRAEMTDLNIYASIVSQASTDVAALLIEPRQHLVPALNALEALVQ